MQGLVDSPPQPSEVTTAVDAVLNGFVFNFETSGQILSRMMFYLSADLPRDWLERYLAGVQSVSANSVHHAFSEHMQPEDMMVLIVGDTERMGQELLATLGPVTIMREKDFH
jgi:zinc protease